jgi:hypothetical protein
MSNEKEEEVMKKKIQYFFDTSQPVHIKFKKDYWKNGYVKEVGSDFFMLKEFLDGELPVFYLEIEHIEKYTKKEETNG